MPDEEDYHTGQKIISPYWQVEGEWVDDATDDFGEQIPALLGAQLAKQQQWKIGDVITLSYSGRRKRVTTTHDSHRERHC